ncbi:hypothetical protein CYK59_03170 [Latilactobacillus curvatus]|nr:hypothetical protein CYK59_03170 [Latilactobacillus curvatus]
MGLLLLWTVNIWLGFTLFTFIFAACAILLNKPIKCMDIFYKIIIALGLLTILVFCIFISTL